MGILSNRNGTDDHIRARVKENEINMREGVGDRFREWRLGFSVEWDSVVKGVVCTVLVVLFALLQTTIFTKFKPFGAVPDLMLSLVVAISMTEREKWGAVVGVAAAFVIESLGGSVVTLLPLPYMLAGYVGGLLTVYRFRDSLAVRAVYTLAAQAARVLVTALVLTATVGDVTFPDMLRYALLPEFFAGVLFAPLPHIAAKVCLRSFNKTRDEMVN